MGSKFIQAVLSSIILAALTACGSSGGSGGGSAQAFGDLSKVQGLWMQTADATELRQTGKLSSLCPQIKKDPESKVVNLRRIDANGVIEGYDPAFPESVFPRIGVLSPTGEVILEPDFKNQSGNIAMSLEKKGEDIVFVFKTGNYRGEMEYTKTSVQEINAYFAAQEACKN